MVRVWLVSQCEKWEGDTPIEVLSDEGIDRYLYLHPQFKTDAASGGYSDYKEGDYSYIDIVPFVVDANSKR